MSWKPIKKNSIGEGVPYVSVGSTSRSGRAKYSQVVVNISATLAQHIGVKPGDRISLGIGILADKGWMMIRKGNEQKTQAHGHSGSVRVRFSGRRLGVTDNHQPENMKYQKRRNSTGPYLIFLLPSWVRREEQ